MATTYYSAPQTDIRSNHWRSQISRDDESYPAQDSLVYSQQEYSQQYEPRSLGEQQQRQPMRDGGRTNRNNQQDEDDFHHGGSPVDQYIHQTQGAPRPTRSAMKQQRTTEPEPATEQQSAWIHRDKLAQIESREMAEAGYSMHRAGRQDDRQSGTRSTSRSASRSSKKRARSQEQLRNQSSYHEDVINEPVPVLDNRAHEAQLAHNSMYSDPSSGEGAKEYETREFRAMSAERDVPQYSRTVARPGSSRIPVAKLSPSQASSTAFGRSPPLTQARAGSASPSDSPADIYTRKAHKPRRSSMGGQERIGEAGHRRQSGQHSRPTSSYAQDSISPSSSSPAAATSGRPVTGSIRKKANAQRTDRAASGAQRDTAGRRVVSGSTPRPSSSYNRPEGEAPWIATMYKPDPMLPPDQQMLPTHAKRMLEQDQMAGTPKKSFDQLDDSTLARMGAFPTEPSPAGAQRVPEQSSPRSPPWPLTTRESEVRSETNGAHPSTTGGGYRITPTINSPTMPERAVISRPESARTPQMQRMPDMDEKENKKKKKSFACCVVM